MRKAEEKTKRAEEIIDNFDFSFMKEKFTDSFPCDDERFFRIESEFKRFMKLVLWQDKPLAMIGKGVDEFWHVFIIFTPQYREFCQDVFGEYIDHQPHGKDTPVPEHALTRFFEVYASEFGEPGIEWSEGYDLETIAALKSGIVPTGFVYKWSGWTGRAKKD